MGHVFISYRGSDRARVAPIVEALAGEGLTPWWDQDIGGRSFHDEIGRKLDTAAAVVALISPAWAEGAPSGERDWVLGEVESARGRLVVARIAPMSLEQTPVSLRGLNHIDLTDWRGDRLAGPWRALVTRCIQLDAEVGQSRPLAAPAEPVEKDAGATINIGSVVKVNHGTMITYMTPGGGS